MEICLHTNFLEFFYGEVQFHPRGQAKHSDHGTFIGRVVERKLFSAHIVYRIMHVFCICIIIVLVLKHIREPFSSVTFHM